MKSWMKPWMKRWLGAALVLLVALGGYYGVSAWQSYRGAQALRATGLHFASLNDALAQARREQRPVFVDFSALWCPSCRVLHEKVFGDARVQHLINEQYVLARVDYDSAEAAAFMQRYGVRGFPSLLLLNGDGSLRRRLPVMFDSNTFLQVVGETG